MPTRRSVLLSLGAAGVLANTRVSFAADHVSAAWPRYGSDIRNTRFNANEFTLAPDNVARLKLKWKTAGAGPIQSGAVIADGRVYYSTWNHEVRAATLESGRALWKFAPPANELLPPHEQGIRDTPHVENGRLYVVDSRSAVHCVDAATGKPIWETLLNPAWRELATHTRHAPNAFDGRLIVGTAGLQPQIACLDMASGQIRWRFYPGVGGSLWTSPAIDARQRIVYNVTGDPKSYAAGSPAPYGNSILAQDLDSGELLWHRQVETDDPFNMDFSTHPMLFDAIGPRGARRACVGAANKRAFHVWDRYTGELVWRAALTAAHAGGGPLADSTAVVYNRIFLTSNAYSAGGPFTSVAACLNAFTGGIEWWVHNPSTAAGGVCIANGVMFYGQGDGAVRAVDAASGKALWQGQLPSQCRGLAVAGGVLYAAHGEPYVQSRAGGAKGPNGYAVHAFSLDGT